MNSAYRNLFNKTGGWISISSEMLLAFVCAYLAASSYYNHIFELENPSKAKDTFLGMPKKLAYDYIYRGKRDAN